MGRNTWDTGGGNRCRKHEFTGDSSSRGGITSPGLTFKRAPKIAMEDSATGQNTYDFLLVFYSNFGRISYRFCLTVDFMTK